MLKLYEKIKEGKPYIIAEMSANHAGDLRNAFEIIEAAKDAGADCIKIQTYTADTLTINCNNDYFKIDNGLWKGYNLYQLYQQAYTPWDWQEIIKNEAEKMGLDFLSTPFDKTSVDFLEKLGVEFYKIASFELVDIPLIEYIASKGKPIIMSCGMGSESEIQEALEVIKKQGNDQVILLKCTSEYPASYEDMNINLIPHMIKTFNVPVGLSDHSMGSLAPVVAVTLGACVIEKHICLDRSIKNPDSEFSMEPHEFKRMVEDVNTAIRIKGRVSYELSPKEKASTKFRRSLFAVEDIKKGEILTEKNIRSIRPADGLKPKFFKHLLGKEATRDIKFGEPLTEDLLNE